MAGDKSVVILAVSWAETVVGLIFFGLRFLSNWKIVARFRPDFAVAGLTVAIQVTAQIFLQLCVHHGMGRHVDTLSHEQQVQTLHWSWVFQLLAIAASMLGKLAILTFLTQIRGRHEKKPWLLIILGVLIAAVNIAVLGTILGQCTPMQKLWDDSLPGTCDPGRKLNQNYSFFQASFNTFSDAFLASYPIHLFWKLQMKLRIKVALSILMGLGWIAAICSAVKTYELKALTETSDITWAQPTLLIWASTEAWIVIVVGCVPPIRPLMERILQRLGLTSKKTSTPAYYHSGSNPYGAGRSLTTARGTNPHFQADAYRSSKSPFAEEGEGDLDWVEWGDVGGRNRAGNGSKEHIVPGGNNVVVTTDIITQFDVLNGNGGGNGGGGGGHVHAISSNGSSGSADDWVRQTPDYRKGV